MAIDVIRILENPIPAFSSFVNRIFRLGISIGREIFDRIKTSVELIGSITFFVAKNTLLALLALLDFAGLLLEIAVINLFDIFLLAMRQILLLLDNVFNFINLNVTYYLRGAILQLSKFVPSNIAFAVNIVLQLSYSTLLFYGLQTGFAFFLPQARVASTIFKFVLTPLQLASIASMAGNNLIIDYFKLLVPSPTKRQFEAYIRANTANLKPTSYAFEQGYNFVYKILELPYGNSMVLALLMAFGLAIIFNNSLPITVWSLSHGWFMLRPLYGLFSPRSREIPSVLEFIKYDIVEITRDTIGYRFVRTFGNALAMNLNKYLLSHRRLEPNSTVAKMLNQFVSEQNTQPLQEVINDLNVALGRKDFAEMQKLARTISNTDFSHLIDGISDEEMKALQNNPALQSPISQTLMYIPIRLIIKLSNRDDFRLVISIADLAQLCKSYILGAGANLNHVRIELAEDLLQELMFYKVPLLPTIRSAIEGTIAHKNIGYLKKVLLNRGLMSKDRVLVHANISTNHTSQVDLQVILDFKTAAYDILTEGDKLAIHPFNRQLCCGISRDFAQIPIKICTNVQRATHSDYDFARLLEWFKQSGGNKDPLTNIEITPDMVSFNSATYDDVQALMQLFTATKFKDDAFVNAALEFLTYIQKRHNLKTEQEFLYPCLPLEILEKYAGYFELRKERINDGNKKFICPLSNQVIQIPVCIKGQEGQHYDLLQLLAYLVDDRNGRNSRNKSKPIPAIGDLMQLEYDPQFKQELDRFVDREIYETPVLFGAETIYLDMSGNVNPTAVVLELHEDKKQEELPPSPKF